MYYFPLVSAADDIVGRFDKLSLSPQSQIELFVQGMDDVEMAKDATGTFIDIEKWSILDVGGDGNVYEIDMDIDGFDLGRLVGRYNCARTVETCCFQQGGSLDFQYVPDTVINLRVVDMGVEGKIKTASLPRRLRDLEVNGNQLTGEFDIEALPQRITQVDISKNKMSGSLAMDCLPEYLTYFNARQNQFSGTVKFDDLPPEIELIDLAQNNLEGPLVIIKPPFALLYVDMTRNKFDKDKIILDTCKEHWMDAFRIESSYKGKIFDRKGRKTSQTGIKYLRPKNRKRVK